MEPLRANLGTADVKIRIEDDPDADREVVFLDIDQADIAIRLTAKEAAELSAFLALAAAAVAERERPAP